MMHAPAPAHHSTTPDTPLGDLPNARRRRSPLGRDGRVYVPRDLLAAPIAAPLFALWVVLATHLRRDSLDAFPSRETIGHALGGITPATVSRLVARLEAAGWLRVVRLRANNHSRNYYRPLGTITADSEQRYAEVGRAELEALAAGHINASAFRAAARWYDLAGRDGWTADSLGEFAERYGTSVRAAKRDRAALVAAGLLEVRTERGRPTATARPGRLPAARSGTQQGRARIVTPAGPESSPQQGQNRHTEVTPVEVTPDEVAACGPARRARTVPNARAAATATPPASKPEKKNHDDEKPEQSAEPTEEQRRTAGAILGAFPLAYRQQDQHHRRNLAGVIARALADGYGPEAILNAAHRHDSPEVNAHHTLRHALRELASDVLAGACPACGHDPDGPRPICDACNPDRDTLTPAELEALEAAGWLTTDEEQHA